MAAEAYFKVSHVRKDGGAGELTLIGFHAEGMALQCAKELSDSPHIRYVQVVQRNTNHFGGDMTWDLIVNHLKEGE